MANEPQAQQIAVSPNTGPHKAALAPAWESLCASQPQLSENCVIPFSSRGWNFKTARASRAAVLFVCRYLGIYCFSSRTAAVLPQHQLSQGLLLPLNTTPGSLSLLPLPDRRLTGTARGCPRKTVLRRQLAARSTG